MTKSDLVAALAEKARLSNADATKALKAFTEVVGETLASGDKVVLPGFGTFSVTDRAARVGRNPQSGAPIQIAAAKVPKFKSGISLKDAIAGK